MPRDYSKPPRSGAARSGAGKPARGRSDKAPFSKFVKKPFERRDDEAEGERESRGPRRPYGEPREGGYRKPFGPPREGGFQRGGERGSRPPMRRPQDDELFTASGKVAEVVGTEPQSRFDMLRKLWDFFRDERLVTPAGRRPRPSAEHWRGEREERGPVGDSERPRRSGPPRKPAGNHPAARRAKTLEDVPRRKYKETREK